MRQQRWRGMSRPMTELRGGFGWTQESTMQCVTFTATEVITRGDWVALASCVDFVRDVTLANPPYRELQNSLSRAEIGHFSSSELVLS